MPLSSTSSNLPNSNSPQRTCKSASNGMVNSTIFILKP